jgi:hypothetical protein
MTVANINVREVLLKRGNTAVSSTYTGPVGELTVDTTLKTVRVHDGVTQGGWLQASSGVTDHIQSEINTINTNVGALLGNLTVSDQTVTGTDTNGDIVLAPNGSGSVSMPGLKIPVGSIIQSTGQIVPIVANIEVLNVIGYDDTNPIPANTYGNNLPIAAPWTVLQLTATPSPILQYGDVLGGAGIPSLSSINFVGLSPYSAYVVINKALPSSVPPPGPGSILTVARSTVNASFQIGTLSNTDIALSAGTGGHIISHNDILPFTNNEHNLGSPALRFKELWLGAGTVYILDETLGIDLAMGARDGNFYVSGAAGLDVGQFQLLGNALTIKDLATDLIIGQSDATGVVLFNRAIVQTKPLTFGDATVQTTAWNGSAAVTADQVTGLAAVATGGTLAWTNLTGAPNLVNNLLASTGINVSNTAGNVTISTTGVLSVAAGTTYSGTNGQIGVANVGQNITLTLPQALATTNNVTFNDMHITGTLTVENFNLSTAPTIAGKILYLAADATVVGDVDGGGVWLGPVGETFSRSVLYDATLDRWSTAEAGLITQDLTADVIFVNGHGHFGNAFNNYEFPNAAIQIDTNVASYAQLVLKNHSDNFAASSDFIATADNGDDSMNFIDVGIASSTYNDPNWPILAPNDGYLYVNGGSLRIGTDSADKVVQFFTGGAQLEHVRMTIDDTTISTYNDYVLQDGNDNVLMQIQNEDGVGKLKFNGGSQGIWYDDNLYINGIGYGGSESAYTILGYETSTGKVSYGQLDAKNITNLYGNANVAAYLPTNNTIVGITANVTAANAAIIAANVAMASYVTTRGYITSTSQSFNPLFTDASGTTAGVTASGSYTLIGSLCYFRVYVNFASCTNFGTGQYQITLPFPSIATMTQRDGTLQQPSLSAIYHIAGFTDNAVSNTILKFYYSASQTDLAWKNTTPISATTVTSSFTINGVYEIV